MKFTMDTDFILEVYLFISWYLYYYIFSLCILNVIQLLAWNPEIQKGNEIVKQLQNKLRP